MAGFVLGQSKHTVHAELGRPFLRSKKDDGWMYEFHAIKPDTSVYAVFKYRPADSTRIYAIELVGDPHPEMHAVRGLKLGAHRDQVHLKLGTPHKTEKVDDPPVTTHFYNHKNYSVDIDENDRLYGIQIFGSILDQRPLGDPTVHGFKNAIVSRNIDSLMHWIAPDLKIMKNGGVIGFSGSARKELNKKDSPVAAALLSESESVWFAFAKEYADGTSEAKLHADVSQMSITDKFFDSNTLSHIIFRPHAGRWKVSEIHFRK